MCRARLGLSLNTIKIGGSVYCLEGDWRAEDTCKWPIARVIGSFGESALVSILGDAFASSLVSKNPIQCLVVCNKTRLYCKYCLSSRVADFQWRLIIGGYYSTTLPILVRVLKSIDYWKAWFLTLCLNLHTRTSTRNKQQKLLKKSCRVNHAPVQTW